MIELLAAMTVLVVGLLAIFAMFESSSVTIRRATTISPASALADKEMENFRAVKYDVIGMTSAALTGSDSTYKADSAYKAAGTNLANEAVTLSSSSYSPTRTLTGADGRSYRVDEYVTWQSVAAGSATGRNVKLVTIVVRAATSPYRVWARISSSFDQSTGS
jgi:Tfp pilus assembly protein PilV